MPNSRQGGDYVLLLLILDLGSRRGWEVSFKPQSRFNPGERTLGTLLIGSWAGPTVGLDTEARGRILFSLPGIEPQRSSL
jgi:hypothetical protein